MAVSAVKIAKPSEIVSIDNPENKRSKEQKRTTIACQAPLNMGFSRQEYWSELPFPSPGDLPNTGIEPGFPALQADSLPTEIC